MRIPVASSSLSALLLALLFLAVVPASPCPAAGAAIEVVDAGAYAFPAEGQPGACPPASGACVAGERLVSSGRQIKASMGLNFGYRYRITGVPEGAGVPLSFILTRPPVVVPESGEVVRGDSFEQTVVSGPLHYDGYVFENEWELVPGQYVFEIRHLGRVLLREVFYVDVPSR